MIGFYQNNISKRGHLASDCRVLDGVIHQCSRTVTASLVLLALAHSSTQAAQVSSDRIIYCETDAYPETSVVWQTNWEQHRNLEPSFIPVPSLHQGIATKSADSLSVESAKSAWTISGIAPDSSQTFLQADHWPVENGTDISNAWALDSKSQSTLSVSYQKLHSFTGLWWSKPSLAETTHFIYLNADALIADIALAANQETLDSLLGEVPGYAEIKALREASQRHNRLQRELLIAQDTLKALRQKKAAWAAWNVKLSANRLQASPAAHWTAQDQEAWDIYGQVVIEKAAAIAAIEARFSPEILANADEHYTQFIRNALYDPTPLLQIDRDLESGLVQLPLPKGIGEDNMLSLTGLPSELNESSYWRNDACSSLVDQFGLPNQNPSALNLRHHGSSI